MTDDPFRMPPPPSSLPAILLKTACMGLALGLVLQVLAGSIMGFTSASDFTRDLAHKLPFALIVCVGLAVGAAAQSRMLGMAIAGAVAGAIGFLAARTAQRAVAGDPILAFTHLSVAMTIVKATEFGLLGLALAWVTSRDATVREYTLVGALIGLLFSTLITAATVSVSSPRPHSTRVAAMAVVEFLFPVGCAAVLFAAGAMARPPRDSEY